jgi:hypothetical protein
MTWLPEGNMADEKGWQVYVSPEGDEKARQHVETCSTNAGAKEIMEYVTPRLPATDRVSTTYGTLDAPGGTFDRRRLTEPQNDWPEDALAPMKAIDL